MYPREYNLDNYAFVENKDNARCLDRANLTAKAVTEPIKMLLDAFDREERMYITFEEITASTTLFENSHYDGFLGIAPW